jgi:hypothetical protein
MKPLQLQLSVKLVHTVYAYTYNHCGGILVAYMSPIDHQYSVLAHWLMKVGDGYHSGRAQADGRAIK